MKYRSAVLELYAYRRTDIAILIAAPQGGERVKMYGTGGIFLLPSFLPSPVKIRQLVKN
jgi:hypothetical protein